MKPPQPPASVHQAAAAIANLAKASQPRQDPDAMVALGVLPELIVSLSTGQEDEVVAAGDTQSLPMFCL